MTGDPQKLRVYLNEVLSAELTVVNGEVHWQYVEAWIKNGFPLSPYLPLNATCSPESVVFFLRNFLPEGDALEEISNWFQISKSNTMGFIRLLGSDLPGALIIRDPRNTDEIKDSVRWISEEELIERLDKRQLSGLTVWDQKPRLSVAGVQDKINVFMEPNGKMGFAEGNLCSTHILKFERRSQVNLVVNEFITMQLAKHCGLQVAETSLLSLGSHRALLVERFDRKRLSSQRVKRRHIIDGCQALDLPPSYKYERNFGSGRDVANIREGASLPKLFEFADQCLNPVVTKLNILRWVLFNCLICNFDAHGKNISFFVNKDGILLAPFYDLVNIAMYPKFEQHWAMALGDAFDGHSVNAYELADLAEACQISKRLMEKELVNLAHKLRTHLPKQSSDFSKEEKDYILDYCALVNERCQHLLKEAKKISYIIV